jgi:hypothetical protein
MLAKAQAAAAQAAQQAREAAERAAKQGTEAWTLFLKQRAIHNVFESQ